jgi:hypothetical protein
MSNDTDYKINISGHSKNIQTALEYLNEKSARWDAFKKEHGEKSGKSYTDALECAMKDAGVQDTKDFVTWGFHQESRIKYYGETAKVSLTAWANENASNRPISGELGELAQFAAAFPSLEIDAEYSDEYSSGSCSEPDYEKCGSSYHDEDDEEEEDFLDASVESPRSKNPEINTEQLYSLRDIEDRLLAVIEKRLGQPMVEGIYYTDEDGGRRYASIEFRLVDEEAKYEFHDTDTINVEIARQYCKDLSDEVELSVPELSNFKKIDDDAAEFLSKNWFDDGSELDLNGLTTLSDAAADSLSKLNGSLLQLGGITDMSDAAIKKIALYPGLHDFHPSIEERLATHRPNNWLEFTDERRELISNVLPFYNEHVVIALGVTKLSETDAKCLLGGKCELYLDDLTELSDAAAEAIGKYQGDLSLDDLTELSDAAAEAIGKHQGYLYLNGLTELSDDAAEGLGKSKGNLVLKGLTELSDDAAEGLGKSKGNLVLSGLTELSDAAAEALGKHQEDLYLGGLTELSDAAAESLGKHQGDLNLSGLTELSDAAAESLGKHQGDLNLSGLTELSDAAAESLSKLTGQLDLSGLTELSDAAAEALGKHQGDLSLNGLTELSDDAAEALGKSKGDLSLNGLTELSDDAAEALGKSKGNLSLNGLTELSDDAAEALGKHQEDLWLWGLTELSNVAAESLSQNENIKVWWSNVTITILFTPA